MIEKNYNSDINMYKYNSLRLKLLKNINSTISYIMSALWCILIIQFINLCFDLFAYLH